jgi:hypothetical protein
MEAASLADLAQFLASTCGVPRHLAVSVAFFCAACASAVPPSEASPWVTPDSATQRVIRMHFVPAQEVARTLNDLLEENRKCSERSGMCILYWPGQEPLPIRPTRIVADARTNSLLITVDESETQELEFLGGLAADMDMEGAVSRLVPLRFVAPFEVIDGLVQRSRRPLRSGGEADPVSSGDPGHEAATLGHITQLVSLPEANAVLITVGGGHPEELERALAMIAQIDVETAKPD